LVLYQAYPPPKPDSLAGLSSSQTGQLIRCPPYPPPTVGILISRVEFLFSRHIFASLRPPYGRRISAGFPRLPFGLSFFFLERMPDCSLAQFNRIYHATGGSEERPALMRRPYGGPNVVRICRENKNLSRINLFCLVLPILNEIVHHTGVGQC